MSLKDYIKGKKQGKEANRLEREAMNDPFLQEALDGFDAVSGNHAEVIDRLEKRFSIPAATSTNKRKPLFYLSIAASILLLIGFGTYFFLEKNRQPISEIAINQPNNTQLDNDKNIFQVDSSKMQAESEMKSETKSMLAANNRNKTVNVQPDLQATHIQPDNSASKAELTVADTEHKVDIANLQEHKVVVEEKVLALRADSDALSEVVVVGYGAKKKQSVTGAVSTVSNPFGEKEFQNYCRINADKNVCNEKRATVKVSFFIDETGKPSNIEYKSYSCEDAKKEVENLLSSSPPWTKINRKVKMTIKW
jgi:cytoskeletal protein RodZ